VLKKLTAIREKNPRLRHAPAEFLKQNYSRRSEDWNKVSKKIR
jgi:hypothetical protein